MPHLIRTSRNIGKGYAYAFVPHAIVTQIANVIGKNDALSVLTTSAVLH